MTRRRIDVSDRMISTQANPYNCKVTMRMSATRGQTEYEVEMRMPMWKCRNLIRELRQHMRAIRDHQITSLNNEVALAEGPLS